MKSNNKILSIAVVLLLLANIALVIFIVKGRNQHETKKPAGKGDPFESMVKELNMTEDQKKNHQQIREEYFKLVKPLFDSVRAAKSTYFALVKDTTASESTLTSYNKHISEIQSTIDKITFEHFRKVRALYKEDQQKKYDEMVQKMVQRQNGGGRKKDSTAKANK